MEKQTYKTLLENDPMNYRKLVKRKKVKVRNLDFEELDDNRLVEMAWQDRMPFDIIYLQYGLTENQVKNKMRKLISKKAYSRWRKRVQGRVTKHSKKCDHKPNRFQGPW
ncbi:MAG: TIGR03643 family protein [uncultured Sulfurovum sp.]|uniref:TIGR03643 family protein n=1 Tax=uncultured Sulfurovum sp. TaxID=269237 RepID=A0A6S6SM80_9BACT|nr:MAG: TIGR03643 family protein [uncultured Sulfurovum sp.]